MNPNHPELKSFIPTDKTSAFPIQNLPYGVFTHPQNAKPHIGVAIGDFVCDVTKLEQGNLLCSPDQALAAPNLNPLMACAPSVWNDVREQISKLLRADNPILRDDAKRRKDMFYPLNEITSLLPFAIGDYTDFYSSEEHATNVGTMFRPNDKPLLPNWKHLPVGYHGRASSVVVSGTPFHRPLGQVLKKGDQPEFGPCERLDYECELAAVVGGTNPLGHPVPLAQAEGLVFGLVLMNDWSARDIQKWEYVPLGPFVSKSFATSISPWVVPLAALEPFRVAGPKQDPVPLPYLHQAVGVRTHFDLQIEVALKTKAMGQAETISRVNARSLYWSVAQQIAHHTITGCNLRTGDLLASGTISGKTPDSYGSLLELTWGGSRVLKVGSEERTFLQDHDQVVMTGFCQGVGYRIGFGDVRGEVLPSL